jgi:ABC-type antimicrobial peptide transport system ATPase subunit
MGKKVSIADRLEKLGHDPLETMIRVSAAAEAAGNLALVAKVNSDLLEYCAPKLKATEHSISPETLDALMTPEQRRERIKQLTQATGLLPRAPIDSTATVVAIHQKQEKQ